MSLYYSNHAIAIISSFITFTLFVYICELPALLAAFIFLVLVFFILAALTIHHIIVDTARYPNLQINVWPYLSYKSDIKYAWGDNDNDGRPDSRPSAGNFPEVWYDDNAGPDN